MKVLISLGLGLLPSGCLSVRRSSGELSDVPAPESGPLGFITQEEQQLGHGDSAEDVVLLSAKLSGADTHEQLADVSMFKDIGSEAGSVHWACAQEVGGWNFSGGSEAVVATVPMGCIQQRGNLSAFGHDPAGVNLSRVDLVLGPNDILAATTYPLSNPPTEHLWLACHGKSWWDKWMLQFEVEITMASFRIYSLSDSLYVQAVEGYQATGLLDDAFNGNEDECLDLWSVREEWSDNLLLLVRPLVK